MNEEKSGSDPRKVKSAGSEKRSMSDLRGEKKHKFTVDILVILSLALLTLSLIPAINSAGIGGPQSLLEKWGLKDFIPILLVLSIAAIWYAHRRYSDFRLKSFYSGKIINVTDDTSGSMAKTKLESSNQLLETILCSTHMLAAYMTADFDFVKVNEAYANAYNKDQSFYPGKNYFNLYPSNENKVIFREVVRTGKPCYFTSKMSEYSENLEKGKSYWDWNLTPVKDDSGKVEGLVLTLTDVTHRKATEEALKRSRQALYYRNEIANVFLSYSDDIIYSKVLEITLEALKSKIGLFGYIDDAGDLVIPSLAYDIPDKSFPPNKTNRFEKVQWKGVWGKAIDEKKIQWSNEPVDVPEGHLEISRVMAAPIIIKDTVIGLIVVANNSDDYTDDDIGLMESFAEIISPILSARLQRDREEKDRIQAEIALKQSEEKYRAISENSPIGICLTDKEGIYQYVNPAYCRIYGYREDQLLGKPFYELIVRREDAKKRRSDHIRGFDIEKSRTFGEAEFIKADGEVIYIEFTGDFVRENGKPKYRVSLNLDITERKKAERELEKHRSHLEQLVQERASEIIAANAELHEEISKHKKTLEELRKSEIKYRSLFEANTDCVFISRFMEDKGTVIADFNSKAIETFRCTREQLVGKTPMDIASPVQADGRDAREKAVEILRDVIKGKSRQFEWRYRRFDGSEFDADVVLNRFEIENVYFVQAIIRDITERKQAEYQQREIKELLRTTLESTADGILAVGSDGKVIHANARFTELWRIPGDLLVENSDEKLLAGVLNQLVDPDEFITKVQKLYNSDERSFDTLYFKDGRIFERYSCPLIQNNQIRGRVWSFRDITVRKRAEDALRASEQKFRALVDNQGEGIAILDNDEKFSFANPAAGQIFGIGQNELIGKNLKDFSEPAGSEDSNYQSIMQAAGLKNSYEMRISRADGDSRFIMITATPLFEYDDILKGILLVIRDVTENRLMKEELAKSDKLESIGLLAGGIAHDFNNYLTAILGNISMAKESVEGGNPLFRSLEDAEKATLQAQTLTRQLLTFSRGGVPIKETSSIVETIRDTIRFTLSGSNVRCEYSFPDNLWKVKFDRGQIGQVIQNLIINADQAMPDGGIIKLTAENVKIAADDSLPLDNGNYLKITIQDSGPGIDEDNLNKIFDPFFTTKAMGNGLGLATAYSIISRHDGHITVKSSRGEGATFTIYLPASGEKVDRSDIMENANFTVSGKILVVDDEKMIRDMLAKILSKNGYQVSCVENGEIAIKLYKESRESGSPYDLVLLDLTIPGGMGGKDIIKKLLEYDPSVRAIVSSGYSNDPIMAEFKKYGFIGRIAKPYRAAELVRTISGMLFESKGKSAESPAN